MTATRSQTPPDAAALWARYAPCNTFSDIAPLRPSRSAASSWLFQPVVLRRSAWAKALGRPDVVSGSPIASSIRNTSGLIRSGSGRAASSSKRSGSRKREINASSSGEMSPKTRCVLRLSAAAAQSPLRARQKMRAGNVGATLGVARITSQALSSVPVSKATSNSRRNTSGDTVSTCSKSAKAGSSAPISSILSTRARKRPPPALAPKGGPASANNSVIIRS